MSYPSFEPAPKDAEIARLTKALEVIRDSKARSVIPWTHEAAADEYSRLLNVHRETARAALGEKA